MLLTWRAAEISSDTGIFFRDFKTGGFIIPRKTETRLVDERRDVTS